MKYSTGLLLFLVTLLSPMGSGILSRAIPPPNDNLNIFAVPVGQGDSTVIQCPKEHGNEISIIDAGSLKRTGFTKGDYIGFIAGQKISNVILTHPNADHVGYVDAIYMSLDEPYPPMYHSCGISNYNIKSMSALGEATQINRCCGKADCDHAIEMCGGTVSIHIIASEFEGCLTNSNKNGDSIITLLEYKYKGKINSFLGMGDFEGKIDFVNDFLECAGSDIKATLLRLAHHGSAGSGSTFANHYTILNAVKAQYVFSSSGARRTFGHPNCEIYDYYHEDSDSIATVPNHRYQCFNKNVDVNDWSNKQTTKAIYTTTFLEDKVGGKDTFTNEFLQFYVGQDTTGFVNDIGGIAVRHVDITQPCSCIGGHVQQEEIIQSNFDHATEENEYLSEYNSNADMQYEGSDQRTENNGKIMESVSLHDDEGFEDGDVMMYD